MPIHDWAVHLLIVDLFPPGLLQPLGIHKAIWDEDCDDKYNLPPDKSLACVAYLAGAGAEAFIDFLAVDDVLPQMPMFLTPEIYIDVPLETTYQKAWDSLPKYWRGVLET